MRFTFDFAYGKRFRPLKMFCPPSTVHLVSVGAIALAVFPYLAKSVGFASHDRVLGVTQTASEVGLAQINEALS